MTEQTLWLISIALILPFTIYGLIGIAKRYLKNRK